MKHLNIIALILALITVGLLFSGCNTAVSETAIPDPTEERVTLEVTDPPFEGDQDDEGESDELDIPESLGIRDVEFSESELEHSARISTFMSRRFDIENKDMGDGSYMYVAKSATRQQFSDYLSELVEAGFTYYTDSRIGNNFFVTFATKTQIATAMYLAAAREVRVVVDDRSKFSLHGLEKDNEYNDLGCNSLTVVAIEETGWPGGMGYIMELADGTFLVIDGGYYNGSNVSKSSANWFYKTLKKVANDPDNVTVAAWLITHPHSDHYGAFVAMTEKSEYMQGIHIEKLIYNTPADEYKTSTGSTGAVSMIESSAKKWGVEKLIKAHPGQIHYVKDAKITVYGSADIVVPQSFDITNVNNLNVVTMVDYMGKRALYLGDSQEVQNPILARLYGKELKTDILQLAHHGYNNTDAGEVYSFADPDIVFWPVSNNHYSGANYGGKVRDLALNQRFHAPGITNYVAGMLNMTISDFETWIPEARWDPRV